MKFRRFIVVVLTVLTVAFHFSYQQVYAARPGAFTTYTFAESGPFFNLDMYITWESAPDSGYIYPAFQFVFQADRGGYIGIQLVGNTRKAIFSIWDISEGSGTAQPVIDTCFRFGHEGSGTGCIIDYDWVEGREYRLRIWAVGTDATGESWIWKSTAQKSAQELSRQVRQLTLETLHSVDHHLVAAVWTDPLTAESRRVETIEAIPVDGTINTLLRVWPIASRLYLPIVLHQS